LRYFNLKKIAVILVLLLVFHISTAGFLGSQEVQAGFLDDHKDSLLTVVKGMIMLWILNLMRERITGNDENKQIMNNDFEQDNSESLSIDISEYDNTIINNEYVTDLEFEMLKIVNKARQEAGQDLLEIDMDLTRIARKKAVDMINFDYFDHNSANYGTPFEMLKDEGLEYSLAGENLAESISVEEAFYSLMDSTEHKANILNSRYDRIGIGIIERDTGSIVIVQIFVDSPDPAK